MAAIRSYRDLQVWHKGMDFVIACYSVCKDLPADERYGLISQLRRAATSVPANIAEGWGRQRTGEYLHFLSIAHGSLVEAETHLQIIERLEYVKPDIVSKTLTQSAEVGRMLNGLMTSIRKHSES